MNAQQVAERSAVYALEDAVAPVVSEAFDLLATAPQGVAKMRELILSLAVAGRLVPHDQDDEPATDLLERICAEKRRRVELGELSSRALRNTSTERDTPNAPENWAWSSLAQIGIINPRNSAPDDTLASFAPMTVIPISMRDRLHTEERKWADIKSGFTHFAEGDVGVAKITPCFQNGKSVVFRDLVNGIGAGTTELHVVRPLCGVVPEYILVFLKSPAFLMNGEAEMTGTAGQRRLPRTYFENVPFPLPPLAEQRRIVARVEELMRLCDELETRGRLRDEQHARLVATLFDALVASASPAELADNWQRIASHFDLLLDRPAAVDALEQTILQLAVRGLLVPQDPADESVDSLLDRIRAGRHGSTTRRTAHTHASDRAQLRNESSPRVPECWRTVPLGNVVELLSGQHLTPAEYSEHAGSGIPYLTGPAEFGAATPLPTRSTTVRKAVAVRGDILITVKGAGVGKLNTVDQPELAISRQLMAIRPLRLVPAFVLLTLETMYAAFQSKSVGIAIPGISRTDVLEAPISIPPLAEQHRIVARAEELRALCACLRQHLQQAQTTQSNLADALVARAAA